MNFSVSSCVRIPSCCPHADATGWWGGHARLHVRSHCCASCMAIWNHPLSVATAMNNSQLSAMDVSVRSTMKGAAKCDKHCELQNSVNRQGLERILCFWDIPESMPASVSMLCCSSCCGSLWASFCDCLCLRMCSGTLEASD